MKYARGAYIDIAREIRLPYAEIGRLARTTGTTVISVLTQREGHFFSKKTEKQTLDAIEAEVDRMREYLNRLSGGATS